MSTKRVTKPEPDKMSGSLAAMADETLASQFMRRYNAIGKRLAGLRPLYVELRKRFFKLRKGRSIMGCRSWTEFCEKRLKYSDRHVRRLIEGDNPAAEKYRSNPKLNCGVASGTAPANSGTYAWDKAAGARPSFAISHSPLGDSETWSREEAVRRIVSWTLSSMEGFTLFEKKQIIEEVFAKLRDEMAFEAVEASKAARASSIPRQAEAQQEADGCDAFVERTECFEPVEAEQ